MRTINILFDFRHSHLLYAVGYETLVGLLKETTVSFPSICYRIFNGFLLMKHIMTHFWFPFKSTLITILPKIAAAEVDLLKQLRK